MSTSTRPVLTRPTPAQRENWRITDRGTAIYWPDIDEELDEAAGFTIHHREPLHG